MPRQQRGNNSRGTLALSNRRSGPLVSEPGAHWLSEATPGLLNFVGGGGPPVPMPEIAWTATITTPTTVTVTWTPPGIPDVVFTIDAFEVVNLPQNPASGVVTAGQVVLIFGAANLAGWQLRYNDQGIANLAGTQRTLAAQTVIL